MKMRQFMKLLHTLGAIGLAGGLGTFMIVLAAGPEMSEIEAYSALRATLDRLASWVIVPSMGLVMTSGLMAMAVHYPFSEAPWVWIKALSGLPIFEATLNGVAATAEDAAIAAAMAAAGEISLAELAATVEDKWVAWWVLLGLNLANVVLAVFRPRFGRKATD